MALGMPTFTVELYINAAWVNVSAYVNPQQSAISIQYGRSSQSDDGQPGTCSFSLENSDGRFTPDNPASPYYGYIVPGTPVRVGVTSGVYRFTGRVVSWNPTYTGVSVGDAVVNVTCKDALGSLQDYNWDECLAGIGLRDGYTPVIYARMTDPRPYNGLRNATSYPNKYGVNAFSDFTWTNIDDPAAWFGATAIATAGNNRLGATAGDSNNSGVIDSFVTFAKSGSTALVSKAAVATTIQTVSFWFRCTSALQNGEQPCLVQMTPRLTGLSSTNDQVVITLGYTGQVLAYTTDAFTVSAGGYDDGDWHHVVWTTPARTVGSTPKLYIDGVDAGTVASYSLGFALPNMQRISVGALHSADIYVGSAAVTTTFRGSLGPFAAYATSFSLSDAQAQYRSGPLGSASALSRLTTLYSTSVGGSITNATTGTGKSTSYQAINKATVLDTVLRIIRGDNGTIQARFDGGTIDALRVTLNPKAIPTTISYTFDVEADLDGPPVFENSSQGSFSEVTATSPTVPDQTAVSPTVTVPNSQTVETALANRTDLLARASLELVRSGQTALRLSQVTVDVVTSENSATMSSLLNDVGLLGRLIRITNIPSIVFGKTYIDGYILGVNENITATSYTIQLDLAPVDAPPVGRASDSAALTAAGNEYSRAGSGGLLTLTSGITSSATSLSITGTGPMLSTNSALYPLDLDVFGERVTVTAAPASSASPQTVTVTRGIAPSVARAHNAGETINVWRACHAGF